jgi:hypothetical protein
MANTKSRVVANNTENNGENTIKTPTHRHPLCLHGSSSLHRMLGGWTKMVLKWFTILSSEILQEQFVEVC